MLTFRDMSGSAEWRCAIDALRPGATAKFRLECGGRRVNGFMVNHDGDVHAYVNRCPHAKFPLNWQPDVFLAPGGSHIRCVMHGALFEIESGICVAGPCMGHGLQPLGIQVRDGYVLLDACVPLQDPE